MKTAVRIPEPKGLPFKRLLPPARGVQIQRGERPTMSVISQSLIGFASVAAIFPAQCLMAQTGVPAGGANGADRSGTVLSQAQHRYVPQTETQRLEYYFKHLFSGESVLRSAAAAGITQALNTPHEWGQGADGYGRRFASSYGGHIIQSTVMYATSTALHEDNRYFRSGETGFGARLKYAVKSAFLARHDDGSRHISISAISSYAAAAGIARIWQPRSTRGAFYATGGFAVGMGVEAGLNIAREFLPNIFHSRAPMTTSQTAAQ
jgi:hypothetical protein